jgi:transposase
VPEIAQSLGIGNNLIYYWIKQAKKGQLKPEDNSTLALDEEKMALHKRIKELEMEREILKKALGIFSRPM